MFKEMNRLWLLQTYGVYFDYLPQSFQYIPHYLPGSLKCPAIKFHATKSC